MTQFCPKLSKVRLRLQRRVLVLQRCVRCFWDRLFICSPRKPSRYRVLSSAPTTTTTTTRRSPPSATVDGSISASRNVKPRACSHHRNHHDHKDSDLVPLKISLLGDPETGKTSFLVSFINL